MAALASPQHLPFVADAVFALDRWLRRHQGIFEYADSPDCIFRLARGRAERSLVLADGTRIALGAPTLDLHLWNEHIPAIPAQGVTLQWARRTSRAMDYSLRQLASYLAGNDEFRDIAAIRADMRIATPERRDKLALLVEHYGFEAVAAGPVGRLRSLGENILMMFIVWAVNPAALRGDVLRRGRALFYCSRRALERRYRIGAASDARDAA
ncbi:MAG TPA: hypothetical protein VFB31_09955 [Pseudolabrys sp.]|nr:hypothetical protein [Pseudolabrys sp.]